MASFMYHYQNDSKFCIVQGWKRVEDYSQLKKGNGNWAHEDLTGLFFFNKKGFLYLKVFGSWFGRVFLAIFCFIGGFNMHIGVFLLLIELGSSSLNLNFLKNNL